MREDSINPFPEERDAYMTQVAAELQSLSDEISTTADYDPLPEDE